MPASLDPPPASVSGSEPTRPAGHVRARWAWTAPTVWTDRMLTALETGVKGGRWFSLIDKVCALPTLRLAFARVKANRGSATACFVVGCAAFCGSGWAGRSAAIGIPRIGGPTINAGRTPSLPTLGCSRSWQPMRRPVGPLAGKTTDWRAVCGRTARPVRREGTLGTQPGFPTSILGCVQFSAWTR